jgi:hypothetical protein
LDIDEGIEKVSIALAICLENLNDLPTLSLVIFD